MVAEEDGELVGFGSMYFDADDGHQPEADAEVTALYVRRWSEK